MTIEIPLTRGMVALIDDEDLHLVEGISWNAKPAKGGKVFYATGCVDNRMTYMHRRIMGQSPRDGVRIDHKDGDGLNNTRLNLRPATPLQNSANRVGYGVSGFRGVTGFGDGMKRRKPWKAYIGFPATYLGAFATAEEAAKAYDAAARDRHGEFAAVNFPLPGECDARRAA